MGQLVNGQWRDEWYDTSKTHGEFVREQSQFRNWITTDGQPGPTGKGGFSAESGRYHLYISLACPWAHRTLIFLSLKNLTDHISVNIVQPHMLQNGWEFSSTDPALQDTLSHKKTLYEIYLLADPYFSGRVTVPVLWDKQQQTIVNNESAEIIRMFNSVFNHLTGNTQDYYPLTLANEIDALNQMIYANINNGVYQCGFATSQRAYENAFQQLFEALNTLEQRLANQTFLFGEVITESDWRLFTTLIRFDAVYVGHFKCNLRRIQDYPHLSRYLKNLFHWPGIRATVNFTHIKQHYYYSHIKINPTQIVPVGPLLDL